MAYNLCNSASMAFAASGFHIKAHPSSTVSLSLIGREPPPFSNSSQNQVSHSPAS